MSMRSDASMDHPIVFKSGDTKTDLRYMFLYKYNNSMSFYIIKIL